MAIGTTMGVTTGFNVSSGLFTFTDVNPYVAEGIALSAVKGWLTIVAPDGQTWHQGSLANYDIDPNVALTNTTIVIPTDATGDIQAGEYTITYTINVTGGVQPGTYSKVYTIDFCDVYPTPTLDIDVDVFCAIITATDITSLVTSAGTWTLNSRSVVLTNAYNLAVPQNTTGTGVTTTVSTNIYPGTWAYSITLNVTLTTSTHTCTNTLIASGTFQVEDYGLCDITCCLKSLYTRYSNAKTAGNTFLATEYWGQLEQSAVLLNLISNLANCGQSSDATARITELKTLLNCTGDCGCGDDEPTPLVPICGAGAGTSYNFLAGTGLTVTVAGGNVTYGLTPTNAAILAGAENAVVTSSDGTLTVSATTDPSTSPPTTTYDTVLSTATKAKIPKEIAFDLVVSINVGGAPTLTAVSQSIYDSTVFQAPTLTAQGYTTVNSVAIIRVSNFMVSGTATFKHMVQVTDLDLSAKWDNNWGGVTISGQQLYEAGLVKGKVLDVRVQNKNTNAFDIVFRSDAGFPGNLSPLEYTTWNMINTGFTQIRLTVRIVQ